MNFLADLVASIYDAQHVPEPEEYPASFTANMATLLSRSGLSPKQLAERVGMKLHQLNYLLYGTGKPKPALLLRLIEVSRDYSLHGLASWFEDKHRHLIYAPRRRDQRRD